MKAKDREMSHKGKVEFESFAMRPAKRMPGGEGAEPAVIHEVSYKTHRGGQGGGPAFDLNREEVPHTSRASAKKHFDKVLDHVFGEAEKKGENEPDGGGTGKPEPEDKPLKGKTEEPGEEDEVGD